MTWENSECTVTASIGICLFSTTNVDTEDILRLADHAMFAAKQNCEGYRFSERTADDIRPR
jgi:predicted signal transduction protein with EAL and GGDEF domain